jgi:hypothetical protein
MAFGDAAHAAEGAVIAPVLLVGSPARPPRPRNAPMRPSSFLPFCKTYDSDAPGPLVALLRSFTVSPFAFAARCLPLLRPRRTSMSTATLFALWLFAVGVVNPAAAQLPLMTLANGTVRTLAGQLRVTTPFSDGVGTAATFFQPHGVAFDSSGALALIVSTVVSHVSTAPRVLLFFFTEIGGEIVTHFVPSPLPPPPPFFLRRTGSSKVDNGNHLVRTIAVSTGAVNTLAGQYGVGSPVMDGVGTSATFYYPAGVALGASGALALVVSRVHAAGSESFLFRSVCLSLSRLGKGLDRSLTPPCCIHFPRFLYRRAPTQADYGNHLIRAITVSTGAVRTLAGQVGMVSPFSDGVGSVATFYWPYGVSLDTAGSLALVVSTIRGFCVRRHRPCCLPSCLRVSRRRWSCWRDVSFHSSFPTRYLPPFVYPGLGCAGRLWQPLDPRHYCFDGRCTHARGAAGRAHPLLRRRGQRCDI